MDPITDIFETMRVAAFLHARIEATAPWGLLHEATEAGVAELAKDLHRKVAPNHLAYFGMIARGNCWLTVEGTQRLFPAAIASWPGQGAPTACGMRRTSPQRASARLSTGRMSFSMAEAVRQPQFSAGC